MARPDIHNDAIAPAFVPEGAQTRYLVARREDGWVITFNGEEYGPYKSEREALLFAIDAAQKFGEQAGAAQVVSGRRKRRPAAGLDLRPRRLSAARTLN